MENTWIYVTWTLVGILLFVILIALVIVCLKNKRFSRMRSKIIGVLSMRNYEEDDFFLEETEIRRKGFDIYRKGLGENQEQYYSSTERVFDGTEHIPIPRVNHIKFTDHSKSISHKDQFEEKLPEGVFVLPLSLKPKLSLTDDQPINPPPTTIVKSNSSSAGLKATQTSTKTSETFYPLEETTLRFNPDLFEEHSVFPRAKLVNFRGKSGSVQITSVPHNENVRPKKRQLPTIDPVENKPVPVKHVRQQKGEECRQLNRETFLPLGKSLTYSPGDKSPYDEKYEKAEPRTQSLYDKRGRPLKKRTKKPSGVIIHEEIGPDFVIINKTRISSKDRKTPSKNLSKTKSQENTRLNLSPNDGIKRKNKPPPLNLTFSNLSATELMKKPKDLRKTEEYSSITELTNKPKDLRNIEEFSYDVDPQNESPYYSEQTDGDLEFSPEIQWKLKGDENMYELVYIS